MGKLFSKILKKGRSTSGKIDQYQEDLTFAEAAAYEYVAKPVQASTQTVGEQPGKLLVIGQKSEFPQDIIDYAVDMAQRLSYDIIALNTAPLKDDSFKFLAAAQNKDCQEFKALSEKNSAAFRARAEEKGISWTQAIKFSDIDTAIEEIRREFGEIDFVISGPEKDQRAEQAENSNRPTRDIFVYSMA